MELRFLNNPKSLFVKKMLYAYVHSILSEFKFYRKPNNNLGAAT